MIDRRLLGTWKSDARRTMREVRARRDISEARARRLANLFGRLELRFTPTRCSWSLNGDADSRWYKVTARDSSSVTIIMHNSITDHDDITHVHFVGPHFWINVGTGLFREFFRKVNKDE